MTSSCSGCGRGWPDHRLVHTGSDFELRCPMGGWPHYLGATHDIAQRQLQKRVGDVADDLWEAFGEITVAHHIFFVARTAHSPGRDCEACAPGWPRACRDHGDCGGTMHCTLENVRSGKVYRNKSQLAYDDTANAYRNLQARTRWQQLRTPYRAAARCDTCGSLPSEREVRMAIGGQARERSA